MKATIILTLAALALPCIVQADESPAKPAKPVVAKKPPTHSELSKAQKKQLTKKHGETPKPIKPLVNIQKSDMLARSAVFVHNGNWSMIPRKAVIYTPKQLKGKIVAKPKGKYLRWPIFLQKYGGFFHTHEVTMLQAKGKEKVNPKAIEAYKGTGKIVVATYHRQPITVKAEALRPEEVKPGTAGPKATTPKRRGPQ